jgi:hypothetical protein
MKPNKLLFKIDQTGYVRLRSWYAAWLAFKSLLTCRFYFDILQNEEQQEEREEKQISGNTVVRICLNTECVNNLYALGEYGCNCKVIEIWEGKCQQYIKREKTNPPKFT